MKFGKDLCRQSSLPLCDLRPEQLDRARLVARRAAIAIGKDQRQTMGAFSRAGIGGLLDQPQAFALGAAFHEDGTQPRRGVGVRWRQCLQ